MHHVRLIYSSHATSTITRSMLTEILAQSRTNNEQLGITGLLCAHEQNFIQCLEGSYANVNRVYNQIIDDPRHSACSILSYDRISERLFGGWSMAHVEDSRLIRRALVTTTKEHLFLSLHLLGNSSVDFMKYLAEDERGPSPVPHLRAEPQPRMICG